METSLVLTLTKSLSPVVVVLSIHPMAAQGFAFVSLASQSLHKARLTPVGRGLVLKTSGRDERLVGSSPSLAAMLLWRNWQTRQL